MVQISQEKNLGMMLSVQSCQVTYIDTIHDYSLDRGGVTRITQDGIISRVESNDEDNISRKEILLQNSYKYIKRNRKYLRYQSKLEDCFMAFEEEIELNMLNIIPEYKAGYIKNIFKWLNNSKEEYQEELDKIWKNKPKKENLAKPFIEYIKSKNLDFENIDEFELSYFSLCFQDEPHKTEFERLNEDEKREIKKFNDYYNYQGWIDREININEINIKEINDFLEFFLKPNYSEYIDVDSKVKKLLEPTHSFKYNTPKQQEQLESILNLLKDNDSRITFVNNDVKLIEFKRLFKNIDKDKIKPIKWEGSLASLRYFLLKFKLGLSNTILFKTAYFCFDFRGKRNYSQIENAKQVKEKDRKAIDNIFFLYPKIN